MGAAVLVRCQEAAIAQHPRANVGERAPRRSDPVGTIESATGTRHAEDRQRIPGHEHLVVASRPDALLSRGKKFRPRRLDERARLGRLDACEPCRVLERTRDMQMPVLALEVGSTIEAPVGRCDPPLGRAEDVFHLLARPNVELALFVLGIGV